MKNLYLLPTDKLSEEVWKEEEIKGYKTACITIKEKFI